jgi:nucleoside-diphosphate-sugar epimerase
MNISITGHTGFVGKSTLNYFKQYPNYNFTEISIEKSNLYIDFNLLKCKNDIVVIHLAGIAHDVKNVLDSDEYYFVNTELTKKIYDFFLESTAKIFIMLSSVKAVADVVVGELTEEYLANPNSHYGKSKLLAEEYILSKKIPKGKRVYILRSCMIHGPGNKGNLNILYQLVSKSIPWPLGSFNNKRSFCSIDNLLFILKELMERQDIPSGVYNVSDDEPISTNELISILAESKNKHPKIWKVSKGLVQLFAKFGNLFNLPLNEERLQKLTDSYVVSNKKIKLAIGKSLPLSSKEGVLKTFKSFS